MSAERQLGRARFGCVFVAYENRAPHRSPATARSGRAHALCLLHRQRVLRPLADEPALRRSPRRRRASITVMPANRRSSRDGGSLFTPVVDGSIAHWDLRPSSWVNAACRLVGRNLTRAEWHPHVI